jgi:hypothetical protein
MLRVVVMTANQAAELQEQWNSRSMPIAARTPPSLWNALSRFAAQAITAAGLAVLQLISRQSPIGFPQLEARKLGCRHSHFPFPHGCEARFRWSVNLPPSSIGPELSRDLPSTLYEPSVRRIPSME